MPPETKEERDERITALTAEKAQAEALVEAYKLLEGQVDELAQAERDLLAASVALIKEQLKAPAASEELTKEYIRQTAKLKDLIAVQEDLKKEQGAGTTAAQALQDKLFGLSGASQKLSNLIPKSKVQFKAWGKTMKSAGSAAGLLSSAGGALINATVGLVKAQDEAISSFRSATGATAEYNSEITQTERRNFIAGVSAKDAAAGFQALHASFSAFTQLNQSQRAALQDTTVLLQKLDVAAGTTGAIFDQAFRAGGMSVEEANNLMLDLAGSAKTLGVPMKQLAGDFTNSFGTLVQYGDRAMEVFKGLAVQAKNTGLAVGDLIKITAQFDTFDGAAKAVGRLNAILGGPYLNSIDMLNASEEERIEILTRQVDMAGIQFDALQKYEQKAIASSLGMSVEEANRLFRMGEEEYKLQAIQQEELAEQAREVQTIGRELKSMFMALAVDMRPLIDTIIKPAVAGIAAIAKGIGNSTNALGSWLKLMIPLAGLIMMAAAPFTGGASLAVGGALLAVAGTVGLGAYGATVADTPQSAAIMPGYDKGGTIAEPTAQVHANEMVLTGGQGAEVLTAKKVQEIVASAVASAVAGAIKTMPQQPQKVIVQIGETKFAEATIGALNSQAGRAAFSPLTNA